MTYIYNSPESKSDVRYEFQWKILKSALEGTYKNWGPYVMIQSQKMTESRQIYELQNPKGNLTIMYLSPTPALEKTLIPIRIPVDKNLSGYFVFLIRKENQQKFNSIQTLDDLHRFSCGLGKGWIDVEIMKSSGFNIITGSNYDGLFKMLSANRFTMFPRSCVEVIPEYEANSQQLPDIKIEDNLLFYYPLPMYFWFSKTDEGRKLAERVEEGMRHMISDGSYDKIFYEFFGDKIKKLKLNQRRKFSINNPNLGKETPFKTKELWFDPEKMK